MVMEDLGQGRVLAELGLSVPGRKNAPSLMHSAPANGVEPGRRKI
jgi:hypothetical protein